MYNRVEIQHGAGAKKNKERLKGLAFYQRKLLVHAMKFPGVKRIVYSTCSINSSENEDVIAAALEWGDGYSKNANSEMPEESATQPPQDLSYLNFKVKEALPSWSHRIQNFNYEWSELCVKADLENDLTDGFFVVVLEKVKTKK
jgi:putative methyltransferase